MRSAKVALMGAEAQAVVGEEEMSQEKGSDPWGETEGIPRQRTRHAQWSMPHISP